ncbi:MAG: hypothetical protein ABIC40_07810 [bacterium]
MMNTNREQGSAWIWILTIIGLIVISAAVFLGLINQKIIPAPSFLASQPWMAGILPKAEEATDTEGAIEIPAEDTLRKQLLDINAKYIAAEARIKTLEGQIDENTQALKDKDDEVAKLHDALNLASNQNVQAVAAIYESMDPKDAAIFLANLGSERAALILKAMRESKAAKVMELMDPQMATEITQLMAGFNNKPGQTSGTPKPLPSLPQADTAQPGA